MKKVKSLVFAILLGSLMFNCGGKEEKKKAGFTYERTNASEVNSPKESDNNMANIVLTANDVMQYNTNEIRAKAGQKVKLTLRHIGKLDINVMGHNVVILKQGVDLTEFAGKAATERENKYIPKDSKDIIAHTDLIGGGQITSIEFEAPEAGTYEFLCSFPGHSGMMKGKFIVE
jgi:azurin